MSSIRNYFIEKSISNSSIIIPNNNITKIPDITYLPGSSNPKHKLDLYLPNPLEKDDDVFSETIKDVEKEKNSYPVIIFIHGGGWKKGDKTCWFDCYGNIGRLFASKNYICAVINYRLTPEVKFPDHILDCAHAVKFIYHNIETYGGNRDLIFISGHSAGGHLSTLLSLDLSYFHSVNFFDNNDNSDYEEDLSKDNSDYEDDIIDITEISEIIKNKSENDSNDDDNDIQNNNNDIQNNNDDIVELDNDDINNNENDIEDEDEEEYIYAAYNSIIKGVAGLCGPYNITKLHENFISRKIFVDKAFGTDLDDLKKASPTTHTRKNSPPMFLANANIDFGLDLHAIELKTNLEKHSNLVEHVTYPGNHVSVVGLFTSKGAPNFDMIDDVVEFFDKITE